MWAIAVLIVTSVWMFAMHQARTGGSPNLPLKWLGFAGMTAIVFGYAIRAVSAVVGKTEVLGTPGSILRRTFRPGSVCSSESPSCAFGSLRGADRH